MSRAHVEAVSRSYALGQADEQRMVLAYLRRLAAEADGPAREALERAAADIAGFEHRADDIPF